MPRKLHPMVKLDKDVAEALFGHRKGRPTISARAGHPIGRALRIGPKAGTDVFHGIVAVAGAAVVAGLTGR